MNAPRPAAIDFRPVTDADLPLVANWLAEPHVARWWGDRVAAIAEIRLAMAEPATDPYLIVIDGEPIGYIQSYDVHGEGDQPFSEQPAGSIGIDITIGVPSLVGRGIGPLVIEAFVERLFAAGAPRIVIDPDPANHRAIRAYAKAGFTPVDERPTMYGPALLMVRDNPNHTRPT